MGTGFLFKDAQTHSKCILFSPIHFIAVLFLGNRTIFFIIALCAGFNAGSRAVQGAEMAGAENVILLVLWYLTVLVMNMLVGYKYCSNVEQMWKVSEPAILNSGRM